MLARARDVKRQSAGTPLEAPSQTLIRALIALRAATGDDGKPARELEETRTAVLAMLRVLAGVPLESAQTPPGDSPTAPSTGSGDTGQTSRQARRSGGRRRSARDVARRQGDHHLGGVGKADRRDAGSVAGAADLLHHPGRARGGPLPRDQGRTSGVCTNSSNSRATARQACRPAPISGMTRSRPRPIWFPMSRCASRAGSSTARANRSPTPRSCLSRPSMSRSPTSRMTSCWSRAASAIRSNTS